MRSVWAFKDPETKQTKKAEGRRKENVVFSNSNDTSLAVD
jgi:hypothetical protein